MSEHMVTLRWERGNAGFGYDEYSRDHTVAYGENGKICASAAPEYRGNVECLDPEQAFVSSLSSCHMLTFLALASKKKFVVDSYVDDAIGFLGKNEKKQQAMTRIELRPKVLFSGEPLPSDKDFARLHAQAHTYCFIANSIASCIKVHIEPEMLNS